MVEFWFTNLQNGSPCGCPRRIRCAARSTTRIGASLPVVSVSNRIQSVSFMHSGGLAQYTLGSRKVDGQGQQIWIVLAPNFFRVELLRRYMVFAEFPAQPLPAQVTDCWFLSHVTRVCASLGDKSNGDAPATES